MSDWATLDRAGAADLPAVQEDLQVRVVELKVRGPGHVAEVVERLQQRRAEFLMDLAVPADAGRRKQAQADLVVGEGLLLAGMILLDHLFDGAGELALGGHLAVLFDDGRTVAVGSGNEDDVVLADAVAQEAGEGVSLNEYPADVAEVKVLVAVRHAACDNRALGELRTRALPGSRGRGSLAFACGLIRGGHRACPLFVSRYGRGCPKYPNQCACLAAG